MSVVCTSSLGTEVDAVTYFHLGLPQVCQGLPPKIICLVKLGELDFHAHMFRISMLL